MGATCVMLSSPATSGKTTSFGHRSWRGENTRNNSLSAAVQRFLVMTFVIPTFSSNCPSAKVISPFPGGRSDKCATESCFGVTSAENPAKYLGQKLYPFIPPKLNTYWPEQCWANLQNFRPKCPFTPKHLILFSKINVLTVWKQIAVFIINHTRHSFLARLLRRPD